MTHRQPTPTIAATSRFILRASCWRIHQFSLLLSVFRKRARNLYQEIGM